MTKIATLDNHHVQLKSVVDQKKCTYVLITCSLPSDVGEMEVEMSYVGEPWLISYMIAQAQDRLSL